MSVDILNALTLWGPKLIAILAVTAVAYVVIEGLTEKKAMNSRIKAVLVERIVFVRENAASYRALSLIQPCWRRSAKSPIGLN